MVKRLLSVVALFLATVIIGGCGSSKDSRPTAQANQGVTVQMIQVVEPVPAPSVQELGGGVYVFPFWDNWPGSLAIFL